MAKRASAYIQVIEHRLGAAPGQASTKALDALCMAVTELSRHPWYWTGAYEAQLQTTVGQAWVELPATTVAVQQVVRATGHGHAHTALPVPELAVFTRSSSTSPEIGRNEGAYGVSWRDVDGRLIRTLELGIEEKTSETIGVWIRRGVSRPDSSLSPVTVPDFLELALEELACAIALGREFAESGSVAARTQQVWDGTTMESAISIDSRQSDTPEPQLGRGAVAAANHPDINTNGPRYEFL